MIWRVFIEDWHPDDEASRDWDVARVGAYCAKERVPRALVGGLRRRVGVTIYLGKGQRESDELGYRAAGLVARALMSCDILRADNWEESFIRFDRLGDRVRAVEVEIVEG